MQRLFTALSLPNKTANKLTTLRPVAGERIQAIETTQFHITLHFIGQADTHELADILSQVQASAFSLQLERLGKFNQSDGGFILWAGVHKKEGLMTLYKKIATVLSTHGYLHTAMDYIPHVTLARCKSGAPNELADKFLSQAMLPIDSFTIVEFGLYSSSLDAGRSIYRCERTFSLAAC